MEHFPNGLPDGWTIARLKEIVSVNGVFSDGDWVESKDQDPNGSVRLVQLADIGEMQFLDKSRRYLTEEKAEELNCTLLCKGDLLISRLGDPLGKTCVYPAREDKAVTAVDVCILRPANESIEPKLFGYFLNGANLRRAIDAQSSGTTRKRITGKKLKALPVPVPPSNEQRQIVEKIETLFARLDKGEEALREVQKLLSRYRQSVLEATVTGQLTADWRAENAHRLEHGRDLLARILQSRRETWEGRGKYKEPVAPDASGLPELPEGWVWATLPMLGEFGRGKSKHRPRNDPKLYKKGKFPFLQTGRVRNSGGKITGYDALYNELGLGQSKLWPKGTVCITIAANIAESGILELDACFPDSVVGLVPHAEVNAEYVECFIRTAKENLDRYAPATAQKNINLEILNNLAVPLPSSEEQMEIRDRLDQAFFAVRAIEHICEAELARSAALRQSILKNAFSGRLVPQDPADEPAAELLARIKETRFAAPRKSQRKATA